jgi:hypothetical protein
VVQPILPGCSLPAAALNSVTDSTVVSIGGSGPTCAGAAPAPFSISGQIRNAAGSPLAGATVSLAGAALSTQTTTAGGGYSFTNLLAGSYVVQANLLGCLFVPSIANLNSISGNTIQNFDGSGAACGGTSTDLLTISGEINNANGMPLSGVTVQILGLANAQQTTGAAGGFSFANLVPGPYVVQPSLAGCSFTPSSLTYGSLTDSATAFVVGSGPNCGGALTVNAGGTAGSLAISGRFVDASGAPLIGARVDLAGAMQATRFSDFTGSYVFHVNPGAYSMTPSGMCSLIPQSVQLHLAANFSQNFTATSGGCVTAAQANSDGAGSVFTVTQGGAVVGRTFAHVENRSSATDALARLKQIAAEQTSTVTSLTIAGSPAIQRQTSITYTAIEADEGGIEGDPPTPTVWVTTAVAMGSKLVRLESPLTGTPTNSTIALFANEGINLTTDSVTALVGTVPAPLPLVTVSATSSPPAPLTSSNPALIEVGDGELEIAASDTSNAVVYATQNGPFVSFNGGQSVQPAVFNAPLPLLTSKGDPMIGVGPPHSSGNQTFYYAQLYSPGSNTNGQLVAEIGLLTSTDNGATFNPALDAYPVSCVDLNSPCVVPDQEQLVVDRTNQSGSNVAGQSFDQLYLAWRNFAVGSGPSIAIACSRDGGQSWLPANYTALAIGGGDFPRLTVSPDGSVLVAYGVGSPDAYELQMQKFSSCANGFQPVYSGQSGFPYPVTVVPAVAEVPDLPGLDRRPQGNYHVTFDDADPSGGTAFLVYATASSTGNVDIHALESLTGGASWGGGATINTVGGGARYFPWICSTAGKKFVTWYDRRDDPIGLVPGLTSYFRSSLSGDLSGQVHVGTEFNVSGTDDPQCASGFPGQVRTPFDELGCSGLPSIMAVDGGSTGLIPAGTCQTSGAACDFRAPSCSADDSCVTGLGIPKYGDYNGAACALGTLYMAWASSTPPRGAECLPNGISCGGATNCCSGNCVSPPPSAGGTASTICAPSASACEGNGSSCGQNSDCCAGNCEGGQCLPAIALYASSTACLGPTCNQSQVPGADAGADSGFGITVSATAQGSGPNICISGTGFTPNAEVRIEYFNIPANSQTSGTQGPVSDAGTFALVDTTQAQGQNFPTGFQCTSSQLTTGQVLVTATDGAGDAGTGNVANGTIPTEFFCPGLVGQLQYNGGCPAGH